MGVSAASNGKPPETALNEQTPLLARLPPEPQQDDDPPAGLERGKTGPVRLRLLVFAMVLAAFLSALDLTIVATCIPAISSDLEASDQGSWIGTAYLASTVTFTPLYGRLSDIIGRRSAFLQALVLFGLGTLGCGLAGGLVSLALARFVAGMGGAGAGVVASVIVGDLFEMRDRGFYQGMIFMGVGAGLGLGGPLGGILTEALGWRAAFYLQLPFCALNIALVAVAAHAQPHLKVDPATLRRRIDFGGSLSLFISMTSLLFCLSLANANPAATPDGGSDRWRALTIALAVVCAVFLLVFAYVELYVAPEPVLPLTLLAQRTPLCVGFICGLIAIVNFSMVYFLPMFFEIVLGKSVSESGAHLIPNSIAMTFGSIIIGYAMKVTGRFKWLLSLCCLGPVISMLLLSRLNEHSGAVALWLDVLPMGFGFSGLLTATLIAIMSSVDKSQNGVATGFVFVFRSLGQVLGVSIASAIFQASLNTELHKRFDSPEIIDRLRRASESIRQLGPADQAKAAAAFKVAIHHVFFFAAAAAVVVFLASLPIPDRKLDHDEQPAAVDNTDEP